MNAANAEIDSNDVKHDLVQLRKFAFAEISLGQKIVIFDRKRLVRVPAGMSIR